MPAKATRGSPQSSGTNCGPSAAVGPRVFGASLLAFYGQVVSGTPRNTFSWTMMHRANAREAVIVVGNLSAPPQRVSMWAATTTNGHRDWRLLDCRSGPGRNCTRPEAAPAPSP